MPTDLPISEATGALHDLNITHRTFSSFTLSWAAQDEVFDQFFITLKDLSSLNRTQEIFLPGNHRETEITNLSAGTQYQINLHGSTQGQLSWSLEALATTGIFYGFISHMFLFCFEIQNFIFVLLFHCRNARLCEWCISSWLFILFLPFARDKTLIAMEWDPWVVQHGQCPVQLSRWCSINSLFSNCMQRETLMHLLFTRHMKIARCYRFLSGLWFKHKKDCKEVAVCSIGMEVVMSEEKKDCNTLGAYLSENFHLLSLLHEFHEETGL